MTSHTFHILLALLALSQDGEAVRQDVEVSKHSQSHGREWHVQLVPDDFCEGKPKRSCKGSKLKPMNGKPHMFFSEFLEMAELSSGNGMSGPINGWGALSELEVKSITCKTKYSVHYLYQYVPSKGSGSPSENVETWRAALESAQSKCQHPLSIRSRMEAPSWSEIGWSASSPGFVFSFDPFANPPQVAYGDNLRQAGDDRAVRAHLFTHRYSVERESWKDKLTWHSGVVLEWEHGRHLTVVELAWLNGLGGYKGKSNWYDDKLAADGTLLFKVMPSEMKSPWDSTRSEIRVLNVQAKSVEEFRAYLEKYSEIGGLPQQEQRFLEPQFPQLSGDLIVDETTRSDILGYLVNYNRANLEYSELGMNCQAFAADFFRFLTGKPASVVTPILKLTYHQHTQDFKKVPQSLAES